MKSSSTEISQTSTESLCLTLIVPSGILDIINENFSGRARERAVSVIYHILHMHQLYTDPIIRFGAYSEKVKQRFLTTRFYKVWQQLVDLEVLQEYKNRDGITFHWKKRIPKRYRFHPKLIRPPYVRVMMPIRNIDYEIDEHPIVQHTAIALSNISVRRPEQQDFDRLIRQVIWKLRVRSTLNYVTESSIQAVNKKMHDASTRVNLTDVWILRDFDINNRVYGMIDKLAMLDAGIIFASRSETNSRLNHNLTNLDKSLFPFLRLDGDHIMEHDMSNSQPLLLSHLLKNLLSEHPTFSILYDPYIYSYLYNSSGAPPTHHPQPTILSSHLQESDLDALRDEVDKFYDWCRIGKFYDNMGEYCTLHGQRVTRQEIKNGFVQVLFEKYNVPRRQKWLISERFPTIVKFLDEFKRTMYKYCDGVVKAKSIPDPLLHYFYSKRQGNKTPFEAGNDYLAIRLQEIEAAIMINRVLSRLMDAGLSTFSRHDSICCKESDTPEVLKIMRDTLDEILGDNGYDLNHEMWK